MKVNPVIALFMLFFSCSKEPKPSSIKVNEGLSLNWNKIIFDSVRTQQYSFTIFDSCLNENIDFSGTETYKLKQSPTATNYYIYYEIDLTQVTGTGEVSGTKFTGGGVIRSMTKEKDSSYMDTSIVYLKSGTDTIISTLYKRIKEVGRDTYKVKYTSPSGHYITLLQKDVYKEVEGVIVVDNTSNPLIVSCK